ncbi:hypothetical protein GCM10022409_49460 [Hymenobacter glaciei]|uniref:Uncharacterized protein n=1 Tax=Hymenobacter glaciei TaxID=877209 RepID=A0ABP7UZT9_9BACT
MSVRLKTINADAAAYEGFRQLAKECELTSPELVAAMVQYFRVTKADPRAPTGPDLTSSLAKITAKLADLDKRTIGFIREQEKTYLKPILAQVQAQQLLSAPAASVPAGPSAGQVQELTEWFLRLIRRTMQPTQLTQTYLNGTLPQPPAKGQADPLLDPIKSQLMAVLSMAFRPELMIPAKPSTPPAPAVAPPSPAPQP